MTSNDPVDHMMDINDNLHQQIAALRAEKVELQTELQTTKDELEVTKTQSEFRHKTIKVLHKNSSRRHRYGLDTEAYWAQLLKKLYEYAKDPEACMDRSSADKLFDEVQCALETSVHLIERVLPTREEMNAEMESQLAHIKKMMDDFGIGDEDEEEETPSDD